MKKPKTKKKNQPEKLGKPRITYLTDKDVDPSDYANINRSFFLVRVTERLRKDPQYCFEHKLQLVEHDGYLVRGKAPITQGGPYSRHSPPPRHMRRKSCR